MKLPEAFVADVRPALGEALFAGLVRGLQAAPPVSVRLNPAKPLPQESPIYDMVCGAAADPVPWCGAGRYLPERPAFTLDPLLHAGCYYVQEAASMFVDRVLRTHVHAPVLMLDLCAAPGGKTTAARAALPAGSLLVSNEPHPLRAQILAENVQKWGHPDSVVTHCYPDAFCQPALRRAGVVFDVVLCDVPCSGEGMFRKDPDAVGEWSPQNVERCCRTQRDILAAAWQCLKPGGLLVYSTCTFNRHEDEEQVLWLCDAYGAEPLAVPTEPEWGICTAVGGGGLTGGGGLPAADAAPAPAPAPAAASAPAPCYRFLPGHTRSEGLFVCALRKPGTAPAPAKTKPAKVRPAAHPWLVGDDWRMVSAADTHYAVHAQWADVAEALLRNCRTLLAGVALGKEKGKPKDKGRDKDRDNRRAAAQKSAASCALCPDISLALSTALRPDAFPRVVLSLDAARAYLRREAPVLPPDTPTGYVLATYAGRPLGFIKNLGTRANNLYPPEWRIRAL